MAEIVEQATFKQHNTVVIDKSDCIWITFCADWWEFAAWIVWWLQPGKKAWLQLKVHSNNSTKLVRVRAKRIAKSYVRMG